MYAQTRKGCPASRGLYTTSFDFAWQGSAMDEEMKTMTRKNREYTPENRWWLLNPFMGSLLFVF